MACQRHIAAARLVSDYDFNNTYVHVIAREDLQLNRPRRGDRHGLPPDVPEPTITVPARAASQASMLYEDRDGAQRVLDKWTPRVHTQPPAIARC